jgi:hypothetical protein
LARFTPRLLGQPPLATLAAMLAPLTAPGTQPRSGPDGLVWSNRFHALGPSFYTELGAEALPEPHWVAVSEGCACRATLSGR